MKDNTMRASSSIKYPPGPHSILPNKLLREFIHNPIKSRGLQISKRLLGEGLVTSEGEYHDRQRRIIQPAFHPNHIKRYADIMTTYAVNMCQRWQDGMIVDIHKEMMHTTLEIISKT